MSDERSAAIFGMNEIFSGDGWKEEIETNSAITMSNKLYCYRRVQLLARCLVQVKKKIFQDKIQACRHITWIFTLHFAQFCERA